MWRWKKLSRFFTLSSPSLWTALGKSGFSARDGRTLHEAPELINTS
jgi:hypothetical protein